MLQMNSAFLIKICIMRFERENLDREERTPNKAESTRGVLKNVKNPKRSAESKDILRMFCNVSRITEGIINPSGRSLAILG